MPIEPLAEFKRVTPDLAKQWLDTMVQNRRVRQPKVREIARDIRAGQWKLTGDALKFDQEGRLIDGQHRLLAVIESETAVDSLVVSGLDPAVNVALDVGARRSHGDHLVISGLCEARDSAVMASALKFWVQFCAGPDAICNPGFKVPPWAMLAIGRTRCTTLQPWVVVIRNTVFNRIRMGSAGSHIALAYVTELIDPALATEFWHKVTTGTRLEEGDPEYRLREAYARIKAEKMRHPRGTYVAMAIKAWNARRAGTPILKLGMRDGENFPAIDGWPWPCIDLVRQIEDLEWDSNIDEDEEEEEEAAL